MVYNSNSDSQDIVSLLNDYTGNYDDTNHNVFPLKQKTRYANQALKTIWSWIFDSYGGWQFDDANNNLNCPSETANLVANQKDYTIPTEAKSVKSVSVKDTGGVWGELAPLTTEQITEIMAENEFMKTSSSPMYFVPFANSIKIYPAPDYSQASSIRVIYDRGTVLFDSTDTTQSPGFASEFHEAVAVGGSLFYCIAKDLPRKNDLMVLWQDYEKRIKEYYSRRYQKMFPPKLLVSDAVCEYK
jgi:hypothetical protein